MDEELKHVCEEIDLGRRTREELVKEGISNFADLIQADDKLKREKVGKVRDSIQKDLVKVVGWYHHFEKQQGRKPAICDDFTEDTFEDFKKIESTTEIESALSFYKLISHKPEASHLYSKLEKAGARPRLIQRYTQEVINNMTDHLKSDCQHKFDFKFFAEKLIDHITKSPDDNGERMPFVVAGRTQAGKSSVKGVIATMCGCQKMPLIVITKGVSESHDLHAKLKSFVKGTPLESQIVCLSSSNGGGGGQKWKNKMNEVSSAFEKGGTLVVADTHNQIGKAILCVKKYREGEDNKNKKFAVAVDECDAMYRTSDRQQKMEQAYDALLDMKPALTVMISATPIPLMLELVRQADGTNEKQDIPLFFVGTTEEYMGINRMKRLGDDEDPICLEQKELDNKGCSFVSGSNISISIPYSSEKVKMLYDDALASSQDRNGILVLDCTSPRVYVDGNIFQKAEQVQDFYALQGKPIVVVTYAGRGISVKYPSSGWEERKNILMNEMISEVDEEHGLQIPIFIFAFTKMRRGISFRSGRRVPTHMVIQLGQGHNAMNVVQAMGRATFNGKSVLESNGFQHVTLLTTASDYEMSLKTQTYIEEIYRRMKDGTTFVQAVTGADQKMPDSVNFLRHTTREVGQLKGQRLFFEENVIFDEPDEALSVSEEKLKSKYWANDEAQRLFRVLLELSKSPLPSFRDDICEAYNDTFLNEYKITKTQLNKWLSQFTVENLIIKKETSSEAHKYAEQSSYGIKFRKRFRLFINDHLALTKEERKDDLELEDILGMDLGAPSLESPTRASTRNVPASRSRPGSVIDLDNSSVSNLSILSSVSNRACSKGNDARDDERSEASEVAANRLQRIATRKSPKKKNKAGLPMQRTTSTGSEGDNGVASPAEEEASKSRTGVKSASGRKLKPRIFHAMEVWAPSSSEKRKVAPRISVKVSVADQFIGSGIRNVPASSLLTTPNRNRTLMQPKTSISDGNSGQPNLCTLPNDPTGNQNPAGSQGSKKQKSRSSPETATAPANVAAAGTELEIAKAGVESKSGRKLKPRNFHPMEVWVPSSSKKVKKRKVAPRISVTTPNRNRAMMQAKNPILCGNLGQANTIASPDDPTGNQNSSGSANGNQNPSERRGSKKQKSHSLPETVTAPANAAARTASEIGSPTKGSTPPTSNHSKKRVLLSGRRRRKYVFSQEQYDDNWSKMSKPTQSPGNIEESGSTACNFQINEVPCTTRKEDGNNASPKITANYDNNMNDNDDKDDTGSEDEFPAVVTQEDY